MSQWQPIESAPKDGTRLLGWVGNLTTGGVRRECSVIWWSAVPGMWVHGASEGPTHWMPLPEPPEDEFITIPRIS